MLFKHAQVILRNSSKSWHSDRTHQKMEEWHSSATPFRRWAFRRWILDRYCCFQIF